MEEKPEEGNRERKNRKAFEKNKSQARREVDKLQSAGSNVTVCAGRTNSGLKRGEEQSEESRSTLCVNRVSGGVATPRPCVRTHKPKK